MTEVFYTDDTKIKDLTVGQLKDIIIETLNSGLFTRFEPERRQYTYTPVYKYTPVYPDPLNTPYCSAEKGEVC